MRPSPHDSPVWLQHKITLCLHPCCCVCLEGCLPCPSACCHSSLPTLVEGPAEHEHASVAGSHQATSPELLCELKAVSETEASIRLDRRVLKLCSRNDSASLNPGWGFSTWRDRVHLSDMVNIRPLPPSPPVTAHVLSVWLPSNLGCGCARPQCVSSVGRGRLVAHPLGGCSGVDAEGVSPVGCSGLVPDPLRGTVRRGPMALDGPDDFPGRLSLRRRGPSLGAGLPRQAPACLRCIGAAPGLRRLCTASA